MARHRSTSPQAQRASADVQQRAQRRHRARIAVAMGTAAAAAAAAVTAAHAFHTIYDRIRMHNSIQTGYSWVRELLDAENPTRIYNALGMHRHVFVRLVAELGRHGAINDTRYVTAEEQVAIFLRVIKRNASNRDLQERFQRSGSTIS